MEDIELNEKSKDRIKKLSAIKRVAVKILMDCINRMAFGECSEEEICSTISKLNDNSKGRYGNDDLLNYDEAGRILGFGSTNRVGLKKLLDDNNIKQIVINNQKVGFPRDRVLLLNDELKNKKGGI